MRLILKQKGLRQFKVLFKSNNVHTFELPSNPSTACDEVYRILGETVPTVNPDAFYDDLIGSINAISKGVHSRINTSFYSGGVCISLEV